MTEHTPTPWIAAAKCSSVVGVPIVSQTGQHVANTSSPGLPEEWPDHRKRRSEANAALIVEAVNNHEALKAEVSELRDLVRANMAATQTAMRENERLRSELEQAKDYVAKALASFESDPADNRFLKGFQAALEVVRDEAFSSSPPSTDGERT